MMLVFKFIACQTMLCCLSRKKKTLECFLEDLKWAKEHEESHDGTSKEHALRKRRKQKACMEECLESIAPKPKRRKMEKDHKITHGPSYVVNLEGLGVILGLGFSFPSYDFGNCFIIKPGIPPQTKVLTLTNKDEKEISVECLYPNNDYLRHTFESGICIPPGKSYDMTFTFCPREAKKYVETIQFEINGLLKQCVLIIGTGTELKVEVADPKHKIVNLGASEVTKNSPKKKKFIPIVNNSLAPVTFNLALTPETPALQSTGALTISPTNTITLEPGDICKVEVAFASNTRIPQFSEEVTIEFAGQYETLFVVKGQCLGMEISLDTTAIPFPTVVKGSSSSRKLVMSNTGDMTARFKWDVKKFRPDFSIYPVEGCITPGMDVTYEVIFEPKEAVADIRYDNLRCFLEDPVTRKPRVHPPVTLTLTGGCTAQPTTKEVPQHFTCPVRSTDTKNLQITNKTSALWNLKPVIDAEYWSGPLTFTVEPQTVNKQYPITYYPLTMTQEGKKHTGTVFFPLPDGTGLLFTVSGTAEPPKMNGGQKILNDIPCKVPFVEHLPVENWLKRPQRFSVKWEVLRQDTRQDTSTDIKGMSFIDVPANGKKDYKLNVFTYKETTLPLKVVFTNDERYELQYKFIKGGTIETIELTTPVRQSAFKKIKLENTTKQATTFNIQNTIPEILMPNTFSVPPQSTYDCTIEYQPLKVGESLQKIEVVSNDLGSYVYELKLKATPARPEKALYFRAGLGQSHIQVAKYPKLQADKGNCSGIQAGQGNCQGVDTSQENCQGVDTSQGNCPESDFAYDISIFDKNTTSEDRVLDYDNPPCKRKLDEKDCIFDKKFPKVFIKGLKDENAKSKHNRVYDCVHACLYCEKVFTNIQSHLEHTHGNQKKIKEIKELKDLKVKETNPEKIKDLEKRLNSELKLLRNLGDHHHNMKVIQHKEGELLLPRRRRQDAFNLDEYGPCPQCKEWMVLNTSISSHQKTCAVKISNYHKGSTIIQIGILTGKVKTSGSKRIEKEVFPSMKRDNIAEICMSEPLILALGDVWFMKNIDNKRKRKYYASFHMRLAARLLLAFRNSVQKKDISVSEMLCPENFDKVTEIALQICNDEEHDEEHDDELQHPSTAIKSGFDLMRMASSKVGISIKTSNERMKKEGEDFMYLMRKEWGFKVNKIARSTLSERTFNRKKELPHPEDIMTLSSYLVENLASLNLTRTAVNGLTFRRIVMVVEARLLLYNRRRPGELEALSLQCYRNRSKGVSETDLSLREQLSKFEKEMLENQELIEIRGKNGTRVPVICPKEVIPSMNYLADMEVRKKAGIKEENPFLFANTAEDVVRAGNSLEELRTECPSLKFPERIYATNLRKYCATIAQVIGLEDHELKYLCRHMGHTLQVHELHYRSTSGLIERLEIAKLMIMQESNVVGRFHGRSLKDITFEDILDQEEVAPREGEGEAPRDEAPSVDGNREITRDEAPSVDGNREITRDEAPSVEEFQDILGTRRRAKTSTRRKWSKEEEDELRKYFSIYFDKTTRRTCPTQKECLEAISESQKCGGSLHKRGWETIKKKMNHWIKKM